MIEDDLPLSVYWPRARRTVEMKSLATKLATLEGKRIAFLWDYLFRGDEIFEIVKRELLKRFPDISFVDYETFGSTHGDDERQVLAALPEKLKQLQVDAVVSGMGC